MTTNGGMQHLKLYPKFLQDAVEGGAIITDGHFVAGNGKHSNTWVDLSLLTIDPKWVERCVQSFNLIDVMQASVVTGPSYGADALVFCLGWYAKVKAIPIEKFVVDGQSQWRIRSQFHKYFEKATEDQGGIVLCDDVLHTGSTLKVALQELMEIVPKKSIRCVAVLLNRGDFGDTFEGIPLVSLAEQKFDEYDARQCPLCAKGIPIRRDFGVGARFLAEQASPHGVGVLQPSWVKSKINKEKKR